ncbi:MAG: VPLPA-CTERM sorting domain-containing protein, partial [Planctomycetota bacterium]
PGAQTGQTGQKGQKHGHIEANCVKIVEAACRVCYARWIQDPFVYCAGDVMRTIMNQYLMPAALSAALMAPLAAHAVTVVNIGDEIVESQVLAVGGTVVFDFEVGPQDVKLIEFGLTGTGISGGSDVAAVTFTITGPDENTSAPQGFTTTFNFGTLSIAGTDLPDLNLLSGSKLSIKFLDGTVAPVDVKVAFDVAPIPLPAAGGMLLTGLAAAGFVARRKKKTAT